MATGIPLPGERGEALLRGIDTGSSMFSRMMQPVLEREKQKQAEEHFKQQMAMRQAEFARSGANSGIQRQILEQQLATLKNNNDPMHKIKEFQMMQNMLGGNTSSQGEMNFEAMQKNPMLRGFFKQQFGFDPLAEAPQTPAQKKEDKINTAISIDEAKSNRKKKDEIEKIAQALLPFIGHANTIDEILTNKPDLTGRGTALADYLGITRDEDVGKFLSASQELQSKMAKQFGERGGYGLAKLVEQAKPNIGKSSAFNKGVISELKSGMRESFNNLNTEYKRLTGEKLPYDFEKYFKEEMAAEKKESSTKRLKFNPATGRLE